MNLIYFLEVDISWLHTWLLRQFMREIVTMSAIPGNTVPEYSFISIPVSAPRDPFCLTQKLFSLMGFELQQSIH